MATAIEILSHRMTVFTVALSILIGTLGYLDSRHASASDVQQLTEVIESAEIAQLEYLIEETQRRMKRIKRIPEGERDGWEEEDLIDLESRKEYLLREMDRLEERGK